MKAKEAEEIKNTYEDRGCRAVVNIYGKRTQNVTIEHDGWSMVLSNQHFASGHEAIMSDKIFFTSIILPEYPPRKSERSEMWIWSSYDAENFIRVNGSEDRLSLHAEIDIYGHFFSSGRPYFTVRLDCARWYKNLPLQFESLESAIQEIRRMDERIKSEVNPDVAVQVFPTDTTSSAVGGEA